MPFFSSKKKRPILLVQRKNSNYWIALPYGKRIWPPRVKYRIIKKEEDGEYGGIFEGLWCRFFPRWFWSWFVVSSCCYYYSYNADAAANTSQKNNDDKSRNNNGNVNRNNMNAIANEITTSSMLMSTTASSTSSPCHKKRKLSSNPNNNNTNVVVTTPFDSSLSTSYDGIINLLNTTLSQQQHILFLPMQ